MTKASTSSGIGFGKIKGCKSGPLSPSSIKGFSSCSKWRCFRTAATMRMTWGWGKVCFSYLTALSQLREEDASSNAGEGFFPPSRESPQLR